MRPGVDPDRVHWIDIETSAFGVLANADSPEKWKPRARETADHSLPYGVAVALLDGHVGQAQFAVDRITAADVQNLMQKIRVRENAEFTASYPQRTATRISIEQAGRGPCTYQVDHPRGHPSNPMSAAEISAKFVDMAPAAPKDMMSELWAIPQLSGPELGNLLQRIMILHALPDRP